METRRVNVCKAATKILKRSDRLTNPNQHLEINMLKKIIALAVAAAFGSVAYAQAPATTPAKPATATTAPAAVTPASKPELKVEEKKTEATPAAHAEEKKDAVKVEKKAKGKHKAVKGKEATTPAAAAPAANATGKPEVKTEEKKVEAKSAETGHGYSRYSGYSGQSRADEEVSCAFLEQSLIRTPRGSD
ncbi:MAG: hypothetical protein IPN64_05240 [Propionivibrio sp.]|uniref:hypothetical protein n=1 Tax=Propionivibrio sp. TaxID=2212460 RepID=UPI0025CF00DE|nr:hypothetical protein [Propionivibrio sp.]MBK8893464.1 hypothetical protein [Propionivibrio sp.]